MTAILLTFLLGNFRGLESGGMEIVKIEGERVTNLYGGVKVTTEEVTINSKRGLFYETRGFFLLFDSVRVTGKNWGLSCDTLYYWEKEDSTLFVGNVIVEDSERIVFTDSLHYKNGIGYAKGKVVSSFKDRGITVRGREGKYHLEGRFGKIWGNPDCTIEREDTLFLVADQFSFYSDSFIAQGNILFEAKEYIGVGDTLIFLESPEEKAVLWGSPELYFKEGESKADSITFEFEKGKLRFVTFNGNSNLTVRDKEGNLEIGAPFIELKIFNGEIEMLKAFKIERGLYKKLKNDGYPESR